jgi:hypothetical protein
MANFNLTDASALFKITYGKLSDNVYNSANVMLGRIKKQYDFVGKRKDVAVPLSFSGGVGAGSLPASNAANYDDAQITAKKVYAVVEIDRETIKASMNDEGSFVRGTKHTVEKGVESYMRNMSRILFGNTVGGVGGSLGTSTAANATGTAADPVIIITAASWKEANWEEGDYVNFNSDSSVFEIISVDPAALTITLNRISGSLDLTGTGGSDVAYMQNSKDAEPEGLKGVLDATAGSIYGIPVARRWQASHQKDASGAGITPDLLNEGMLSIQRKSGKVPNLIVCSFVQFRKILNFLEDQKEYQVSPRSEDLKGKISFRGVEFMSSAGAVPIFPERFVEDDRVYLLNDNYITCHHRPGFGWFDDDGTVFLRKSGEDAYEARYGGYKQNYIVPTFHGFIENLAV